MLLRSILIIFCFNLFLLLAQRMILLLIKAPLQSYAYLINSPDDFSARDVQIYDPNTGIPLNLLHRPSRFGELSLAPDAYNFAFVENLLGIYRSDVLGSRPQRLVAGYVGNPLWSPNGDFLLFSDDANLNLLHIASLEERVLMPLRVGTTWLPDGEHFAYSEFNPESRLYEIRIRNVQDDSVETLFGSVELIVYLAFSPDEKWLAYSVLTGQVVLRELATGTEILIEDTANHFAPQWSADGEYLLFIRTFPRLHRIDIAIANRAGEIIYSHAPNGLTLESSVLWWPQ